MASVAIIPPAKIAGGLGKDLMEAARFCTDDDKAIVGYAVVALYAEGSTGVCTKLQLPDDMLMNRFAFVGMCTEVIREQLVTRNTARRMVNEANGYEDQ